MADPRTDVVTLSDADRETLAGFVDSLPGLAFPRLELVGLVARFVAEHVAAARADEREQIAVAVETLCNDATTSGNEFGSRTFVLDLDRFRAALTGADATHGGNHAPLPQGVRLDPGFCGGCDQDYSPGPTKEADRG